MINTIKFLLYKSDKNDAFYTFAKDNELGLKCEAAIWVVASLGCYIYSQFTPWLITPFVLSIYNAISVWFKVSDAKFQIKKKSIKYLIEYSIDIIFYELKILSKIMREKGLGDSDVDKWQKYYINRIFEHKNISSIQAIIEDIKTHFYKITLLEFPDVPEKEIQKFIKKESKEWWDKYYPNFQDDLNKNAFGKQKTKVTTGDSSSKIVTGNVRLEQSLKVLGLPSTVRDLKTVKNRYYELIRKYHPDAPQNRGKDKKEIQDKIIEINIAYQQAEKILSNQNKGVL